MRATRTTLSLLLALVFALGLLAGCGDSDDEGEESTASSTTEAPADDGGDEGETGESGDAVTIADFGYDPEDLTVAAGTTVTWTNDEGDPVHTVTSEDGAPADFDSDDIEPGATFEQTFDEAGEYPYVCKIHANMSGTVTVE